MRLVATCLLACLALSLCNADAPFPDNKKNHWVYSSMRAIRQENLWYRQNDNVPRRDVPTRVDLATKSMLLAIDSPGLVDSFLKTTDLAGQRGDNAQTKKWAKQYAANFPAKKKLYQTHLERVTKLWKFFKPEITTVAKSYKVDPNTIVKRLAIARWKLDHSEIQRPVAMNGFSDVPANHWAATAVHDLKREGILVGYPVAKTEIPD